MNRPPTVEEKRELIAKLRWIMDSLVPALIGAGASDETIAKARTLVEENEGCVDRLEASWLRIGKSGPLN